MSDAPNVNALAVTAAWERPLIDRDGGETALVVTIRAEDPQASQHRTPVDVAFVLDHSGSMAGDKLDLVKEAVDVALDHLAGKDHAALVIFDSEVQTLQPLAEATPSTKAAIRHHLAEVGAGSSTYLSGGWFAGCQALASGQVETDRRPRRALLLTDGLANHGITDPVTLTRHATELRVRGITTTTIGVGLGFDELLLGSIAEAGGGTFQFVAQPTELSAFFAQEIGNLVAISAVRPTLRLDLPHGARATLVNAFPNRRSGKTIEVELRDLAAGEIVDLVFDISIVAGETGSMVETQTRLTWGDPATGEPHAVAANPGPLFRGTQQDVANALVDDRVLAIVALERAAQRQREAIELDRAGRFDESRGAFAVAHSMVSAAPATPEVMAERLRTQLLAEAPRMALDEETRKERIFSQLRRSRGSRPDPR